MFMWSVAKMGCLAYDCSDYFGIIFIEIYSMFHVSESTLIFDQDDASEQISPSN